MGGNVAIGYSIMWDKVCKVNAIKGYFKMFIENWIKRLFMQNGWIYTYEGFFQKFII